MIMVQVKNIGKKFKKVKTKELEFPTLRERIVNWQRPKYEEFWALKKINFTLEKGQVLGVIGSNGAGKSTLFKILSQITKPTTGEVFLYGQVSSLLEVGTGFHPELSGRENIFLNGAILGMKQTAIKERLSTIIDFAQMQDFIDQPVKYYSSGMYMRLAFSIAAHLTSEIMIIDEVLAVGDADFQKKCLAKIKSLVKKEGRTVLLVSHNLKSVVELCDHCLWLDHGTIQASGPPQKIIDLYLAKTTAPL